MLPTPIKNTPDITPIKDVQSQCLLINYEGKQYAHFTGPAKDGVTIQDATGKMIYANNLAAEIMRLPSLETLLNTPLPQLMTRYEMMDEDGRPLPFEKLPGNIGLQGKEVRGTVLRVRIKDTGEEVWSFIRVIPIFEGEGKDRKIKMVVKILRDITQRKRNEQRLMMLNEAGNILMGSLDYKKTLQNLSNFIVPKFADWCLVHLVEEGTINCVVISNLNKNKAKLVLDLEHNFPLDSEVNFGIPHVVRTGKAELYPEITDELLKSKTKDKNLLKLAKALSLKSVIVTPLTVREKTIGTLTFIISNSNYRYNESDLILAEQLASMTALAVENSKLYDQLKATNRSKNKFLATLSHELRNPLAPILTSIQLIKRGVDKKELEELVDITERQVMNIRQLVDELLDSSRVIQGKLNLFIKPIKLTSIVDNAVKSASPFIESKNHQLNISIKDSESLEINADPVRLEQVLVNLLINAAKYTNKGGKIQISCRKDENNIYIKVKDNGIGIAKEMLPKVFEFFTQADQTLARTQGGLGIGLAFSKAIVELHGGIITAHSMGLGKGSEFKITLPLK